MVKAFLFIFIFSINFVVSAQKRSTYQIKNIAQKKNHQTDSSKIIFTFISPGKEPAKSHIKFTINNDTLFPKINAKGNYTLSVIPGNYVFDFFGTSWYCVKTNSILIKKGSLVYITVNFEARDMSLPGIQFDLSKPAIYFYPPKEMDIEVNLEFAGKISFSYPRYQNGWRFKAGPNSEIECNGKKFKYIFWDGQTQLTQFPFALKEGFIVSSDTLLSFLENTLSRIGLNEKEAQDFITFWVPKMQNNNLNYIHFLFKEDYDKIAALHINPSPDNLIRVFMTWTKFEPNNNLAITPQIIPSYSRNGFSVIDWGGCELDNPYIDLK